MLYKTVGLAAASAVCALMVGCANTTTGKMVEPLDADGSLHHPKSQGHDR